jgi:hypothetical protein
MGVKVFGRREGVPYTCKEATGIEDQVFVQLSSVSGDRFVDLATANRTWLGGLVGVVQTGNWHGYTGTSANKYPTGADLSVVSNGQVRVKCLVTDNQNPAYLADGDIVCVGTGGKAAKWVAPTINPSMTATLGDIDFGGIIQNANSPIGSVDLGAIITAATATIGDTDLGAILTANAGTWVNAATPTAAEIKTYMELVLELWDTAQAVKMKAWIEEIIEDYETAYAAELNTYLEEVMEDYDAALAVKIKAYEAEFVGDFETGALAGYDNAVGRVVGSPEGGIVTVELNGLGGIQNG